MALLSILLPDLRGGGVERIRLVLAHEFIRDGHEVEFVLMQAKGELLQEARASFPVFELAAPRARNVAPALVRYLRCRRPYALLAAMWPLTVIAPFAARIAGFPGKVLVSEHAMLTQQYATRGGLHHFALRISTMFGYRLASARVGVSQGTCADMAVLSQMSADRFTMIHNPVRPIDRPVSPDMSAAQAIWGAEGLRVLAVGNLKPVKNHSLLLEAFAQLAKRSARLMILGQGQGESTLRQLASDLGIEDRVVFAGFRSDPSSFYATADLFVLSSDHEGFGNVIVEALSYGLPVVSTNCPSGPAEILENGRYGRLVPVGAAAALAAAMDSALEEPVDRDALIRRAADFTPEIAARKYLELLDLA